MPGPQVEPATRVGRPRDNSRTPLRPRAPVDAEYDVPQPPARLKDVGESSLEDWITREELLLSRSRSSSPFGTELRRRIMHFTPSWFAVSMGTGVTSILLHTLPYQFNGLKVIALVVFGLNVFLFCSFLAVSIARYILWPSLWPAMLRHNTQSLFLGCVPMALSTIVDMLALAVAPAWGGRWVAFTWALWWINVVVALLVAIGVPHQMFLTHKHAFNEVTCAWLLPTVSTIVAAAAGGVVAEILPVSHARLTVVVSYILWGTGFPVATLILGVYYARLTLFKVPARAQIISKFLPLGPTGSGAFGLLQLAAVVRKLGHEDGQSGLVSGGLSADEGRIISLAIYGASIPLALVVWGFGAFWAAIAVSTIIRTAWHEQGVPFNIGWWALTFPLGVFATATTLLGTQLDSDAFRILGTILSGVVVLNWFCVLALTVREGLRGKLLDAPCLSEMVPNASVHPAADAEARTAGIGPPPSEA